ncbi:ABC transporter substrate-binding protein [Corynebacterium alimapuense]|uniref:Peptide ABC transporter substrate-binding protein n=1 Tax=Corynebacterium alimapuense TaxID=1576874 RepID=A0A3M8KAW9_9CORY|nr:ABC transporter substrate-binding protein [Corynebacterium alimapuense]RNE49608.1 peptide ABC transporter substrate-binding protein [Corynebacterium alimapuense]
MTIRQVAVAFALAAALSMSACSAGSTATQVGRIADADSLVVGTTGVPASLDFTTTAGAAIPQAMMANIYEGLVRIDDDGQIEPLLATSWEVSEDRTVYTFQLREGVRFSDGSAFTADSAVFSINYVQDSWTNGLKSQMAVVSSAKALDEYTLQVSLTQPSHRWLWSMGTLTGAMFSPTGVDQLATNPVGTGPFTLERFAVGESVSLSARADYWGTPAQQDASIRYFSDATSAVNALRSGDIDVVWSMQAPELLDNLPEEYDVQVGTTNGEVLLAMNNDSPPFDDPRVRRAAANAVDRDALNLVVWEGLATDTGGAPVPPSDPWFTGDEYLDFNPERARELLAEAGYNSNDNRPHITIAVPTLPYAQNISELLYSQLSEVGFEVTLESVEFPAVWLSQVFSEQDYDMSIMAHVEARDLPTLFGDPDYYLGFDNTEVQEQLLAADTQLDETSHMISAVETIMAQTGALTVFNQPNIVITAPGITGIEPTVVTDALALAGIDKQ